MTLAEVRTEIDRVDAGIKELFKERMMLAGKIAEAKAEIRYTSRSGKPR